jgi:hypothetical protein
MDSVAAALTPEPSRVEAGLALARAATWESIVGAMDGLILQSVRGQPRRATESRVMSLPRRPVSTGGATHADVRGDDEAIVA